jgi:hypothetical protein
LWWPHKHVQLLKVDMQLTTWWYKHETLAFVHFLIGSIDGPHEHVLSIWHLFSLPLNSLSDRGDWWTTWTCSFYMTSFFSAIEFLMERDFFSFQLKSYGVIYISLKLPLNSTCSGWIEHLHRCIFTTTKAVKHISLPTNGTGEKLMVIVMCNSNVGVEFKLMFSIICPISTK